jgi:hypothetical protein
MRMRFWTVASLVALVLVFGIVFPVHSQNQTPDNMQMVREAARANKKLFVAEYLPMTESEAKGFWPVYESYQKELEKLLQREGELIEDFAKNYEAMTDAKAKKLIDTSLGIEADYLKVKQSFLPKFQKVLPTKKVARYFQIENKIRAALDDDLAKAIPLLK